MKRNSVIEINKIGIEKLFKSPNKKSKLSIYSNSNKKRKKENKQLNLKTLSINSTIHSSLKNSNSMGKRHSLIMSDINKRALHLTDKNIVYNKVEGKTIESNVYDNIDGKYDLIVTNPPIRAGKKQVYKLLDEASNHLKDDGELWFVIRKEQGAKSTIEHLKERYQVNIMERSKGFFIIMAKKA